MAEKEDMLVSIIGAHFYVKSFLKFNAIIPARAGKVEIIYSFIEFQIFPALGFVNFDFSLIFVGTLLTTCLYICLKSFLPPTFKFLATRLLEHQHTTKKLAIPFHWITFQFLAPPVPTLNFFSGEVY